jgi:hypothetical protein
MFVSDLAGLLGSAFWFVIAFAYIKACDALKRGLRASHWQ